MDGGDGLLDRVAGPATTGKTLLIPADDPVSELLEDLRLESSSYEVLRLSPVDDPVWHTAHELTGLFVLDGEAEVSIAGGTRERLQQSDFILLASRQSFSLGAFAADCPCTVGRMTYCLDQGRARLLFRLLPPILMVRSLQPHEIEWHRRLAELIAVQGSVIQGSVPAVAAINRRLVEAALIGVIQQFLTHEGALGRHPMFERISPGVQAIHHAPDQPWTVSALARLAGMSRTAFATCFAESMGETPVRYLAQVRLDRAHDMLCHSRLALAAIAHRAGYSTDVAFARAFRRQFGVSPGQYRAECQRRSAPAQSAPTWTPDQESRAAGSG